MGLDKSGITESPRCLSHVQAGAACPFVKGAAQIEYVEDFHGAVIVFLAFHPTHAGLEDRLARAVTEHATPVGSGTVTRTKRIPVEERAEAAVIAWMPHQTTGYEGVPPRFRVPLNVIANLELGFHRA